MALASEAPRPDLAAYEEAMRLDLPSVVSRLVQLLGARLASYVAGVSETRAVHQWARRQRRPRPPVAERLRFALRIAAFLAEYDEPEVVRAWFLGLNPELDERSPAWLLREGDLDEIGPLIVTAARAFAVGG